MSPIRESERARYPDDWAAISHRIRHERAGGQCECLGQCGSRHHPTRARCTALNGQPHPSSGSRVVLTVAHLDHQPEHNDDANLLAMCQACHLAYDAEHHAQTRAATLIAATIAGMAQQLAQRARRGR